MPTTNPPEQDTPPRPTEIATVYEFGRALRALRTWSKLTQKALEEAHPALTDSTISDHERGVRLPRFEWLSAYVTVCLRHRHRTATREELNAEFEHWHAAWTRLEHTATPHLPTAPVQPAAGGEAPLPVRVEDIEPTPFPAEAPAATDEPKHPRWPRRRVWLVGGGTAVLVLAAAITATTTDLFDRTSDPGPAQFAGSPAPAVPIHASGVVDDLDTKEGLDLDTGQRHADQYAPGVDISFSSRSTHLDAHNIRVSYTVLPEPVAAEKRVCETATGWTRRYAEVHTLTEGRAICVKTDEGRLSMLTVTKRATNATGTISLRFITWP